METRPILFVVIVAVLLSVITATLFTFLTRSEHQPGPRQVFEAHLLALDEGRIDDANAFVDVSCNKITPATRSAVLVNLEAQGLTFQTAFQVSNVWMNERKTEAVVELDMPLQLSLQGVQGMTKVDGEWRLSCGND